MSTTTAPAEIEVPHELLPVLRENVHLALDYLTEEHSRGGRATHDELAEFLRDVERVGAAFRAFTVDADTYPAAAVVVAVNETIRDAETCIADERPTLAEAEFYIGRVRACEALLAMATTKHEVAAS